MGVGVEGMGCFSPREVAGRTKGTQRHIRLCLLLGSGEYTSKHQMDLRPGLSLPTGWALMKKSPREVRHLRSHGKQRLQRKGGTGLNGGATNQVMAPTDRRPSGGQTWPGPWPTES